MSFPVVLNPDSYLNHWSPENAFQIEVARNLYLAVLGVRSRFISSEAVNRA